MSTLFSLSEHLVHIPEIQYLSSCCSFVIWPFPLLVALFSFEILWTLWTCLSPSCSWVFLYRAAVTTFSPSFPSMRPSVCRNVDVPPLWRDIWGSWTQNHSDWWRRWEMVQRQKTSSPDAMTQPPEASRICSPKNLSPLSTKKSLLEQEILNPKSSHFNVWLRTPLCFGCPKFVVFFHVGCS